MDYFITKYKLYKMNKEITQIQNLLKKYKDLNEKVKIKKNINKQYIKKKDDK